MATKPVKPKSDQTEAEDKESSAEVLKLRPEVAAVYVLAPGKHMIFADSTFGMVDLSQIPLSAAPQFAEKGYLKKLSEASPDR